MRVKNLAEYFMYSILLYNYGILQYNSPISLYEILLVYFLISFIVKGKPQWKLFKIRKCLLRREVKGLFGELANSE